mmetsp:Transcript_73592/g.227364  ORF Transcript_73592/g.227364 Transcript_73592/m.227364 type:complete len:225 (-) Transcript_73592:93-767(-)
MREHVNERPHLHHLLLGRGVQYAAGVGAVRLQPPEARLLVQNNRGRVHVKKDGLLDPVWRILRGRRHRGAGALHHTLLTVLLVHEPDVRVLLQDNLVFHAFELIVGTEEQQHVPLLVPHLRRQHVLDNRVLQRVEQDRLPPLLPLEGIRLHRPWSVYDGVAHGALDEDLVIRTQVVVGGHCNDENDEADHAGPSEAEETKLLLLLGHVVVAPWAGVLKVHGRHG